MRKSKKIKGTPIVNWQYESKSHKDYTDLGKYVIDLGTFDQDALEKGRLEINRRVDTYAASACTAIVKLNAKGEVIIGRNQDLELSNYPAYISHFVGGKYQCVCFNYNNKGEIRYDELQKGVKLPENFRELQAASANDAFNEKGLYIQCNMRTGRGHLSSGTNPGKTRVCMGTLSAFVAQNAATVQEALDYLDTLDLYSPGASKDGTARAGWDCAYLIGDATGEFGVIEIAYNKVYYTPYANGHANYYVHPELENCNTYCAGYGRLAMGQRSMMGAQTEKDMMEAIHMADWRRIIEDIHYSYKDERGILHFQDKDGNPSIDYRAEMPELFAVSDEGHIIPITDFAAFYEFVSENAEQFAFLPYLFSIETKADEKKQKKLMSEYEKYINQMALENFIHLHDNCTIQWLMDPEHFEEVKQAVIDYLTVNDAFNLLLQYKNGDDKPIRDKGDIFTTGMNFGVNCAKKHLMVRFFEDEEAIYEYQW